jgi:GTP cyclohydrolase IA
MTDYPDPYVSARKFLQHTITGPDGFQDEHTKDTPRRFSLMLKELTTPEVVNFTTFSNNGIDEMIVVQDIPFYSLCAHHIIPFFGLAHVAYVPNAHLAGLSKFARIVRSYAKGLWVQEELNSRIAHFLDDKLSPMGMAVIMEAEHLCMTMRGVQVPGTKTITSCMLGVFADHSRQARSEFLSLIGKGH